MIVESTEMTLLVLWRAGMMVESTEIALFVLSKSEMEESDRVSGLFVGRPSFHGCGKGSQHSVRSP